MVISSSKIIARDLSRDHIIHAFTPKVRLAYVSATNSVESGRQKFRIDDPDVVKLYGKNLLSSALLSTFLKGEERIIIQALGKDGDMVSRLYSECIHLGELRGFASGIGIPDRENPISPEVYWNLRSRWNGLMSPGSTLNVTKILYNMATPMQSYVPMEKGDIDSAFENYFRLSEQIPTSLRMELVTNESNGQVLFCGGVLAQRVAVSGGKNGIDDPFASDESPPNGWTSFESVSSVVSPGVSGSVDAPVGILGEEGVGNNWTLETEHKLGNSGVIIVNKLLPELNYLQDTVAGHAIPIDAPEIIAPTILNGERRGLKSDSVPLFTRNMGRTKIPLDFFCRCTKDKFLEGLAKMGPDFIGQLEADYVIDTSLAEKQGSEPPKCVATLNCQFCNKDYEMDMEDMNKARNIHEEKFKDTELQ